MYVLGDSLVVLWKWHSSWQPTIMVKAFAHLRLLVAGVQIEIWCKKGFRREATMIVKSEESMCRRRELITHVYLVKMLTKPMNFANHGVPNHTVPRQSIRNLLFYVARARQQHLHRKQPAHEPLEWSRYNI